MQNQFCNGMKRKNFKFQICFFLILKTTRAGTQKRERCESENKLKILEENLVCEEILQHSFEVLQI